MTDEVNWVFFCEAIPENWDRLLPATEVIDENLIQNHYGCVKTIFDAQGSEY